MSALFRRGHPETDLWSRLAGRSVVTAGLEPFDWPDNDGFALIAVGGYGRGELHPHSDVDLLILLDETEDEQMQASISGFLTLLWDINLDIGSSVRTLEECYQEAEKDITIATNLIESRLITGNQHLHDKIFHRVTSGAWSDKEFYLAKIEEQKSRHDKTNDTEYNLEPNLKTSPGGLRDLQTIGWVAKRHFGTTFIHDLVDHGFVTESELDTLEKGERYLWTVRYALHMHCKRREDRLLFDHQRTLADLFGYKDQDGALAVEQFMVKYYRVAKTMSEFNNMLLQYFDEVILSVGEEQVIEPLNKRFNLHNGYIKAAYPSVFEHHPLP
nr:nucleotidyltransferase domain-containing protein [Aliamphritea spongicola]